MWFAIPVLFLVIEMFTSETPKIKSSFEVERKLRRQGLGGRLSLKLVGLRHLLL